MRALSRDAGSVEAAAIALRRELHRNPETAFEEVATAASAGARMAARGLKVRTGLATTGLVAVLDTGRPGPTVLLRADLDGLPLAERTGLPFASTNGRMHACGHDGHVAALDAAADLLLLDPPAAGRVVFAFQPGEEGAGGARAMIAAGALDEKPDAVFGIHLWTALRPGTVGITSGPMMAGVDEFRIDVLGPGGHAASPHETFDPVVAAAHVVTALQTIVSRRLSPLVPAVVSVTSIHGGSAFNILPDSVVLTGTCRFFDAETASRLPALLEATAASAAASSGCSAKTTYTRINPPVVNDPREAERAAAVAGRLVGPGGVVRDCRTMGGEDFSEFLARSRGAFAFVGAALPGDPRPHHSPRFDFDESALGTAARLLAGFARDVLAGGPPA